MADERKIHTTRSGRFLKLGSLSARVGTSYLGERVKQAFLPEQRRANSLAAAHTLNAQRVVKTFGQLKGAAMKLGQQMSLAADILPPEITNVLSQLQRTAPPVPFAQLRDQLETELGRPPAELFERIDEQALASASIGQVHRGRLHNGCEVAIKIQYPGVDQMVESDLANLRSLVRTIGRAWFKADVDKFFEEVRERISEELDYELESYNLRLFRRLLRERPDVAIPEPLDEYSSRRVLTMEYLPGRTWDELCSADVEQPLRDRLAGRLLELLLHEFLDLHVLHADPHPGNYALNESDQLVIYDFGCIKKFEPEFVEAYRLVLSDSLAGRDDKQRADCENLGLRYLGKDPPSDEFFAAVRDLLLEPLLAGQPYPMHESQVHSKLHLWAHENYNYLKLREFDAPPNIIMINRVLAGMYGNFRRLKACCDWRGLIEPFLA